MLYVALATDQLETPFRTATALKTLVPEIGQTVIGPVYSAEDVVGVDPSRV
jgi:hypothetical protein